MRTGLLVTIYISSFLFLTNCTVERRIYQKGWHIEWNGNIKNSRIEDKSADKKPIEFIPSKQLIVIAPSEKKGIGDTIVRIENCNKFEKELDPNDEKLSIFPEKADEKRSFIKEKGDSPKKALEKTHDKKDKSYLVPLIFTVLGMLLILLGLEVYYAGGWYIFGIVLQFGGVFIILLGILLLLMALFSFLIIAIARQEKRLKESKSPEVEKEPVLEGKETSNGINQKPDDESDRKKSWRNPLVFFGFLLAAITVFILLN